MINTTEAKLLNIVCIDRDLWHVVVSLEDGTYVSTYTDPMRPINRDGFGPSIFCLMDKLGLTQPYSSMSRELYENNVIIEHIGNALFFVEIQGGQRGLLKYGC